MEIQGLRAITGLGTAEKTKSSENGTSFSDILAGAIGNAVQTDTENAYDTLALLSDENMDISTSMIAAQKSELAVNLAVQVRNKVVDAYNEIMRMSV